MKKNRGITLLALIITIIIMLLLAGATVSLFGGDSIIGNSKTAVEQNAIESKKNEIEQMIITMVAENDKEITIEQIIEELENQVIINEGDGNPDNGQVKTQPDGYIYEIKEEANGNWKVQYVGKGEIDKSAITISVTGNTTNATNKVTLLIKGSSLVGVTEYTPPIGAVTKYRDGITQIEESYELTSNGTYTFIIKNKDGKTVSKTITINNIIINKEDIANAADKSEYYGAIVKGYECKNRAGVQNWKIFYADENNVYIIADNYIHYDYCPKSATQEIYLNGMNRLSMNDVIKDYEGSENITDTRIQNLNKSYFDYLKTNSVTSTNNNMKAVAYLTDINVWKVYAGKKAEYAIGGPTIEMLLKSYNQKYNTNYQARTNDKVGYEISRNGGEDWDDDNRYAMFFAEDSLYSKEDANVDGMWIASPSAHSIDDLIYANFNRVGTYYYTYPSFGLRPVVCLNSDVKFQKNADGAFTIL